MRIEAEDRAGLIVTLEAVLAAVRNVPEDSSLIVCDDKGLVVRRGYADIVGCMAWDGCNGRVGSEGERPAARIVTITRF